MEVQSKDLNYAILGGISNKTQMLELCGIHNVSGVIPSFIDFTDNP